MPLDYEGYAAIVLAWTAYRGKRSHAASGVADAYHFFDLPVPQPLTLDRMYADFQVIEGSGTIPAPARAVLERFAGGADTMFVKVQQYGSNDAMCLAFELGLFLALDNPFVETPNPFGLFALFPRGGGWYAHYPADTPLLYIAGSRALVDALAQVLDDRLIRLVLSDRYYA